MKVILRSDTCEFQSEHEIPPSEVEAFIRLCREHEIFDGVHDPEIREVITQINIADGTLEIIFLGAE